MKEIKQAEYNQELPKFEKLSEETQSDDKAVHLCMYQMCTDAPYNSNKKTKSIAYLGSFDEAPDYMKDNHFILTGYRINFNTYKKSLQSAFMFSNNEFTNIWSHFIGIIISVCLIITVSSFIAQNDVGVIQKTIQQLDNIYNSYQSQIEVVNRKPSQEKLFNSLLNSFEEKDNYLKQIEVFEHILQEVSKLSKKTPISQEQKQKIDQVYFSLKIKITKQLQTDNLDWVDVYKIFGINRSEIKERRASDPRQISKWPVFFYLLSSIGCFSGSVIYHTFNSMNKKLHYFLLRLDYAGICFVLLGGSVPVIYYGFYCDSALLYFYLLLVILFCSSVFVISLFDFVHSQKYRKLKGMLYGSLGVAVSIPLFHLFYRYQFINDEDNDYLSLAPAIPYYILSGSSLLGGLCIYLARCPERFSPGKFDRIGNSHNIWHLCVVSGIVFGYMFGLENYYSRKQTFCYLK
ncbi:hypothetical protein ABPG72_007321 [Tetrahymena utriculariae]